MLPTFKLDPSTSNGCLLVLLTLFMMADSRSDDTEASLTRLRVNHNHQERRKNDSKITDDIRLSGSAILTALRSDSATNPNVDIKLGPLSEFDQKAFDSSLIRAMNRSPEKTDNKIAVSTEIDPPPQRAGRWRCGSDKNCRRIRKLLRRKWREDKKSRAKLSFESFMALQRNEDRLSLTESTISKPIPNDKRKSINRQPIVITKASMFKRDWCQAFPFKEIISEPGCRSKAIANNLCYGQCNSVFVPQTGSGDVNSINGFKSCSFCKPSKSKWINVTLRCPGLKPSRRTKRVLRIKECRCESVK